MDIKKLERLVETKLGEQTYGPKTWSLINAGLDPSKELAWHDRRAKELREEYANRGRRNNDSTRDIIKRAMRHEEDAAALRKEGVK